LVHTGGYSAVSLYRVSFGRHLLFISMLKVPVNSFAKRKFN